MRITGLTAILPGVVGAALLAALVLPAHASGAAAAAAATKAEEAAPPPPALVPPAPERTLDVPAEELAARPPAEPPPADFAGAQFIDAAGCVFVRTPEGWLARIARDGSAICGYPPTLSARRSAPDRVQPLFPDRQEPRARMIERVLSETIMPSLQTGELADGAHAAGRAGGQAMGHGGGDRLMASDAVDPPRPPLQGPAQPAGDPLGFAAVRAQAPVPAQPPVDRSGRLCRLIGAQAQPRPGIGGSSALGFCGAAGPDLRPRLASAEAGGLPARMGAAAHPGAPRKSAKAAAASGSRRGGAGAAAAQAQGRSTGAAPRRAAAAAAPRGAAGTQGTARKAGDAAALIPPGARYVQVGAFKDAGDAGRTAQRLAGMGLPVLRARQGGSHVLMIGPLPGREAIVRMIDRLRRAGYRNAHAR
ncbi:SPOR domain-containing protein [Paracoccus contaminans]|uniref:SPOR domain-containing protein n=1 Tax=Paracoccus contaminans TaxID=1945662 RepID=A0A1W6CYG6_9RHOB|nr:SPOR domain-containing protein [Paracoccus contaminans]ARJ69896.1 hypothetical protein B0A89_09925 [Paracoccus contaminans]